MSMESFDTPEQSKSDPKTKKIGEAAREIDDLMEERRAAIKKSHEMDDYLKERDKKQAEENAENLKKLNFKIGVHGKGYNPETGEEKKIPVYEVESVVHKDYDPESGKASLEITFKDSEGEHSMILLGRVIEEDGLDHIDPETLTGQIDGLKITKEEALTYWKKYFPKAGMTRRKIGERFPGQSEEDIEEAA